MDGDEIISLFVTLNVAFWAFLAVFTGIGSVPFLCSIILWFIVMSILIKNM